MRDGLGRWNRIGAVVCTALPALVLVLLVYLYAVDIPVLDQWAMVTDIEKYYSGTWGVSDLMRAHNGHRILFPRLIQVPLASLTGWNTRVEMGLSLGLAFAVLGIYLRSFFRILRLGSGAWRWWVAPLLSAAVLSLAQWQNWLWGNQVQAFLCALGAVGGLFLLSRERLSWGGVTMAAALAVLASFSQAGGLMVWPAGVYVIVTGRKSTATRWPWLLGLWLLVASTVLVAYLPSYSGEVLKPPRLSFMIEQPVQLVVFVLNLIGTPVVTSWPTPAPGMIGVAAGVAGIWLWLVVLWNLRKAREMAAPVTNHLVACTVFSLLIAVMIGVSRAEIGAEQALSSRYITLTLHFWVGLCGLALHHDGVRRRSQWEGSSPSRITGTLVAAAVVALLMCISSVRCIWVFPHRHSSLIHDRDVLIDAAQDSELRTLNLKARFVHNGIGVLRFRRLSVWRDTEYHAIQAICRPLKTYGQILSLVHAPKRMRARSVERLRVLVCNPTGEAWPAEGCPAARFTVGLTHYWLHDNRELAVPPSRGTGLPGDLQPGESVVLERTVTTPEEPGRYLLRLSMIQNGVGRFESHGGRPLTKRVVVER